MLACSHTAKAPSSQDLADPSSLPGWGGLAKELGAGWGLVTSNMVTAVLISSSMNVNVNLPGLGNRNAICMLKASYFPVAYTLLATCHLAPFPSLPGRHPDRSVQPDDLSIEHLVLDDVLSQAGVFIRLA